MLIYRWIQWCGRAWPLYIILLLLGIHLLLISYQSLDPSITNKRISLLTQVIGGLLILYTIDSNIGIISKKNLFKILSDYFRSCPLFKRNIVLEVEGGSIGVTSGRARFSVIRDPKNIEEKIMYLQEQINWVKREIEQETKELKEKIDGHSKEINANAQNNRLALSNIESKLYKFSLGSLTIQLFGVSLMIYGAISGYLA